MGPERLETAHTLGAVEDSCLFQHVHDGLLELRRHQLCHLLLLIWGSAHSTAAIAITPCLVLEVRRVPRHSPQQKVFAPLGHKSGTEGCSHVLGRVKAMHEGPFKELWPLCVGSKRMALSGTWVPSSCRCSSSTVCPTALALLLVKSSALPFGSRSPSPSWGRSSTFSAFAACWACCRS